MDSGRLSWIALDWFRNYVANRKQIVNYRSVKSKSSIITCGVPQRSLFGPLLFLIFVNDISESLECLQSAFSLKIRLVLISSSAIANHDTIIWELRRDEKRWTADSFVVNKPSVSPETE